MQWPQTEHMVMSCYLKCERIYVHGEIHLEPSSMNPRAKLLLNDSNGCGASLLLFGDLVTPRQKNNFLRFLR